MCIDEELLDAETANFDGREITFWRHACIQLYFINMTTVCQKPKVLDAIALVFTSSHVAVSDSQRLSQLSGCEFGDALTSMLKQNQAWLIQ